MADDNAQNHLESLLLGALPPAEMQELQRRLAAGDPQAEQACREAGRLLVALVGTTPPAAPPAELKQRILQATLHPAAPPDAAQPSATVRALPRRRTFFQSVQRSLAWAAVFLLFAVGYGYYNRSQDVFALRQERAELQQKLQAQEQEIQTLQARLAFHLNMTKALQRQGTLLVDLRSPHAAPAKGKVIVDRENLQAYFVGADLEVLSEDKDYQLWYIGKTGPVDGGVFQVDASGYGAVDVHNLPTNLSEISAFAVTVEPKGGSVNPTLDQMVLLGRV